MANPRKTSEQESTVAYEHTIYERERPRTRRVFQSRVRQTLMKLRASRHARFTGDHDTAGGFRLSPRPLRKQTRIASLFRRGRACLYGDRAYDRRCKNIARLERASRKRFRDLSTCLPPLFPQNTR